MQDFLNKYSIILKYNYNIQILYITILIKGQLHLFLTKFVCSISNLWKSLNFLLRIRHLAFVLA